KKITELCPDATPALQELLDQCMKKDPAERPASSVEVYLRLVELGKASGILVLPPGAMDKLIAARQTQEDTVTYMPSAAPGTSRPRLLIAGGVLLALAIAGGAGFAAWWYTRTPPPPPTPSTEKLLGIGIGDSRDAVIANLKVPRSEDKFTS